MRHAFEPDDVSTPTGNTWMFIWDQVNATKDRLLLDDEFTRRTESAKKFDGDAMKLDNEVRQFGIRGSLGLANVRLHRMKINTAYIILSVLVHYDSFLKSWVVHYSSLHRQIFVKWMTKNEDFSRMQHLESW